MTARFRPSYSYRDLIGSFFADYIKSEKILTEWLEDTFKSKNIFYYSFGRVGLYVFLTSLGLEGRVVSPAYNCDVVPAAVCFAGMKNQFIDISLDDYNMTPQGVEKAINSKSKIILATHQYGIPCDIKSFEKIAKKNNLLLFEDAAAALGAKIEGRITGRFGDASLISFQDTKIINAINGGCLIVHNKDIVEKIKKINFKTSLKNRTDYFLKGMMYRVATEPLFYRFIYEYFIKKSGVYTLHKKENFEKIPKDYFSGLNVFSLNLIVEQIKDLDKIVERKNKIADIYSKEINQRRINLPKFKKGLVSSWERYPIRVKDRVGFFKKMTKKGIDMGWTFNYTCPGELGLDSKAFPNATEASETILNLPIYPDLELKKAKKIAECVNNLI